VDGESAGHPGRLNKLRGMAQGRARSKAGSLSPTGACCGIGYRSRRIVITEELGKRLESTTLSDLGRAGQSRLYQGRQHRRSGKGNQKAIKGRIEEIKVEIDKSPPITTKRSSRTRAGQALGGVAVIRVGAATETD